MDHIDVYDVLEEDARVIAAFVELLRRRMKAAEQREVQQTEAPTLPLPFAVWPLGVKGTLSREEIYDDLSFRHDWDNSDDAIYDTWREHYHVPER